MSVSRRTFMAGSTLRTPGSLRPVPRGAPPALAAPAKPLLTALACGDTAGD